MKFCYTDESLSPHDPPVQVMVGIIVDAQRLNRTRDEFTEAFRLVEDNYPEGLKELKGSRILYGKGGWRNVDAEIRKDVFRRFGRWLTERRHHLAMSAIDTTRFAKNKPEDYPAQLDDVWVSGAVHIALQIQKLHQTLDNNKGHTILIFDENKTKADKLNDVLFDPPSWTENYYQRDARTPPLSQIVDSAFFTKSHHAGLAQVADIFAFVFRRYAELTDYGIQPVYDTELNDIEEFKELLVPRLIERRHRWMARGACDCAKVYTHLAPKCLLHL